MPVQNSLEQVKNEGNNEPKKNGTNGTKVIEKMEEELPTASVIIPPDGGWGWLVMMASFSCNVIVDGIIFSAGSILIPIQTSFNASKAETAFVTSLLSGFYLMAGPFVSALANKMGFRFVTVVGTFIAVLGFGLSYFATSIPFLYVTYGVIGGIGFCFIYMSSVITVGLYFEKWRPLATGISLCGSGIGTFVFAPLTTYLVKEYEWQGALLAQAGIIALCAIFGLAFRPIKPTQVTIDPTEASEKETLMENGANGGGRLPIIFSKPLPEGRYAYSVPNSAHNTWIGANNNTQYPTAAEVFRGSGADLTRRSSTATTPTSEVPPAFGKNAVFHKLEHLLKTQKRMSGPINPDDLPTVQATIGPIHTHVPHELNTVGEAEEENENGTLLNKDEPSAASLQNRRHTVSGKRPEGVGSRRSSYRGGEGRPLYRDDIFYSGSLAKIPQYQSQSSIAYHMSVTHLPTKKDVEEEIEGKSCAFCPEAVRRTLATMLDMTLLRSPTFIILSLSGFFTMMGFFVPFMYSVPRAEEGGMEERYTSFLISAIGISNTVARILCGMLGTMKSVNTLQLNNVAITLGGLATIFSGVYITAGAQFAYATIFGIAIACFSALRSIIAVELMGLEKLTNAFGLLMLFQGVAAVIGTPLAGFFMDLTGSYDFAFYIAGSLITFSAIICIPLNMINRWEKKRELRPKVVV